MARVELASLALGVITDEYLNPLPGRAVTIRNPDGSNATTYTAYSGGSSSSTGTLTSNSDGTLPNWVEGADYLIGYTTPSGTVISRRLPAVSGSVESRVKEGNGSPEGAMTADVGSLYIDRTNGTYWWKYTGTGNTGWAPNLPVGHVRVDTFAGASTTAKLQAAFAAVSVLGGALIFERSEYSVDTTSAPLFDMPVNVRVDFIGVGAGNVSSTATGTRIKRTAGTNPILRGVGSGTTGVQRCHVGARHIEFHGGGASAAGTVVYIERGSEVNFEQVRIGNTSGTALHAVQLWNSRFAGCFFTAAGTGTGTPAVLLTGFASSESATVTVHFSDCEWEGNTGTDIKLDGDVTNTRPCFGVDFSNTKMEDTIAGRTWPYLALTYCSTVKFHNLTIQSQGGATSTNKLIDIADHTASVQDIAFSNVNLVSTGLPTEFMVIDRGPRVTINGLYVQGAPTNKFIRITANVGLNDVRIKGYIPTTPSLAIDDLRVGTELGKGIRRIPLEKFSAGATAAEYANGVVGWDLADAVFGICSGNLHLPEDAMPNRPITIRARWATALTTGAVRLTANVKVLTANSTDASGAMTGVTTDVTVSGTANRMVSTDFSPSPVVNPGDTVAVRFFRDGGHANDTVAGTMRLLSLDLVYEKQL